ncbi:hypothetical protein FXO38_19925 [Capsicum annuum]|uniref:Jacalin-type lectin domain-containing protein n=1 Tax=Capsicum annuum TaxID=4072 RepID=A0A2G2ZMU8_CAPAN|nr:hypothetical protein FXO38_19925 [Capsicum annuum]KAF3673326.1 hypothetical protein FXO37_07056 [Capsicum annuum]PHT83265.1 hypothetical protein T459_11708 [Capsicum annuum]
MVLAHMLVYFGGLELGQGRMVLDHFGMLELEVGCNAVEYCILAYEQQPGVVLTSFANPIYQSTSYGTLTTADVAKVGASVAYTHGTAIYSSFWVSDSLWELSPSSAGIIIALLDWSLLVIFPLDRRLYWDSASFGHFVLSENHGADHGFNFITVVLDYPSEFITGIRGTYYTNALRSITFDTNKGSHGPYGQNAKSEGNGVFNLPIANDCSFAWFYGTNTNTNTIIEGRKVKVATTTYDGGLRNIDEWFYATSRSWCEYEGILDPVQLFRQKSTFGLGYEPTPEEVSSVNLKKKGYIILPKLVLLLNWSFSKALIAQVSEKDAIEYLVEGLKNLIISEEEAESNMILEDCIETLTI